MSIETFFTQKVSVKGLVDVVGTDKQTFQTKIENLLCYIEQQGEESLELGDGAFYTLFKMWCEEVDIQTGDQVVDSDSVVYLVRGVSLYNEPKPAGGSTPHHLEILLAVPK